jgi:hypothetical protein
MSPSLTNGGKVGGFSDRGEYNGGKGSRKCFLQTHRRTYARSAVGFVGLRHTPCLPAPSRGNRRRSLDLSLSCRRR